MFSVRHLSRVLRTPEILLLAACLLAFFGENRRIPTQADDAYISYRYARNLVEGHGLVYNPGERVEGITNLLWTLLVAAGLAAGLTAEASGHVLGVVSGASMLVFAYLLSARLDAGHRPWLRGIAPWLVYLSLPFAAWTTSGMETALFGALLAAAYWAHLAGYPVLSVALAAVTTMVRPEGVLLFAVLFGADLLRERADRRGPLVSLLVYSGFLVAITGFRLLYYGDIVPNTFHAKVGGIPVTRGLRYTLEFYMAGAGLLLLACLPALRRSRRAATGIAMVALLTVYITAIGGDAFWACRFYVPLLPILAALGVAGAAHASGTGLARYTAPACVLGAAVLMTLAPHGLPAGAVTRQPGVDFSHRWHRFSALSQAHAQMSRLESAIRAYTAQLERSGLAGPGVRVACVGIGVLGYETRAHIIDLVGLVTPEVARSQPDTAGFVLPGHSRSNADWVLAQRPDTILIGPDSTLPAALELRAHPVFLAEYEWAPHWRAYVRRDRLQDISGSHSTEGSAVVPYVPFVPSVPASVPGGSDS